MHYRLSVGGAILLLLSCGYGCVPSGVVPLKPIHDPTARIDFTGFSILPPQGPAWSIAHQSPQAMLFHREIASRTHTFMAEAAQLHVRAAPDSEDFLAFARKVRIGENPDPRRFERIEDSVTAEPSVGQLCARVHLSSYDRGAPQAPGGTLVFEKTELFCLHPADRSLAFVVNYSERRLPAEPSDVAAKEEAEGYLASLRLELFD